MNKRNKLHIPVRPHLAVRLLIGLSLLLQLLALPLLPAPVAHAADNAGAVGAAAGDENWDDRFGYPGVEGEVMAVAVAPNGDVYLGGNFTTAANLPASHIVRWDGRSFHALGDGVNGNVKAILVNGADVYVGGDFDAAGAVQAGKLARWNGTEWSAVGSGVGPSRQYGGGYVNALAWYDNKLIAGGWFTSMDGVAANNVAAWDGANWSALGRGLGESGYDNTFTGENSHVDALLVAEGLLVVGGQFVLADSVTANSVALWDGNGWYDLASGMTRLESGQENLGQVTALAYENGVLYAGGFFTKAGGVAANNVASYTNGAWSALGAGLKAKQYATSSPVRALVAGNGVLYAGGDFDGAGGKSIDVLAQWNGAAWSEIGAGVSNDGYDIVDALALNGNGEVIAGGSVRVIGDKRVDSVARWDGAAWQPFGQGLVRVDYGYTPATPYAIAVADDGRVFAAGLFTRAAGLKADNIAVWNGNAWASVGGANDWVRALAIGDGFLYAAGQFTQIGGIAASHVARMDLATGQWSALGSGINDNVYALAFADGILYAGGGFTAAGDVTAYDVAFWDGAAWHPFGTQARVFEVGDQGGEVGTYVSALAVAGDSVYVGGHFQTVQFGTDTTDLSSFFVVHNVVEWVRTTDQWRYLGTPAKRGVTNNGFSGFGTDVYALALVGNSLFVGGAFNQAGGIAASGLGRYDRATEQWLTLNGSLGGFDDTHVRGLAAAGPDLYVAGKFLTAGAAQARYIAKLDTQTNTWAALGSGLKYYNDIYTKAQSVAVGPNGVWVGGDFDQAGGRSASGLAHWSGPFGAPNVGAGQGGQVTQDGVTANFPAGALPEDAVVEMNTHPGAIWQLPNGTGALYGLRLGATTMRGQQVTQTAKPYTLQLPYTDAQLAAAQVTNPATLRVMYWDGAAWQPTPACTGCGVDAANKVVTAATDRFAPLALVGATAGGNNGGPGGEAQHLYLPLLRR